METVDSRVLLALRASTTVCKHERMTEDAVPQADIATVPSDIDESVTLLDVLSLIHI